MKVNELIIGGAEIWIDIQKYEGLYQISNLGRVKSIPRLVGEGTRFKHISKERIIKSHPNKSGYLQVRLCKNGVMSASISIHRLVAIAFVPNPDNLPEVNHKDEDKLNNSPDNLEWCTKAYNTRYGTRTARTSKPILQYTKDGVFVRRFNSVREASRTLNIGSSNIHNSAVNKVKIKDGNKYICKSAGGFIWHYE